jgi:hypothetical protein
VTCGFHEFAFCKHGNESNTTNCFQDNLKLEFSSKFRVITDFISQETKFIVRFVKKTDSFHPKGVLNLLPVSKYAHS